MRIIKSTDEIATIKTVVEQITKKPEEMPRILLDPEFEVNSKKNKTSFYYLLEDSDIQAYYFTRSSGPVLEGSFFFSKNKELEQEYFYKICQEIIEDNKDTSYDQIRFISEINPVKDLAKHLEKDGFNQIERSMMSLVLNNFNVETWHKNLAINEQDYIIKAGINEEISEMANLILLADKGTIDAQFYPEMQTKETLIEIMGFNSDRIKPLDNEATKLLYANNKLIGINLVGIFNADFSYIVQLAVHPDFKNKKLGTYLMLESLQTIKEKGIKMVRLHVTNENSSAKHIYKKLGFIDEQTINVFSRRNTS